MITVTVGDDDVAGTLANLVHLEDIVLECPRMIFTSKALDKLSTLQHLETLSFIGTAKFEPDELLNFVKSVPTLCEVEITAPLDIIPPSAFQEVGEILLSRGGILEIVDLTLSDDSDNEDEYDSLDDFDDPNYDSDGYPIINPNTGLPFDFDEDWNDFHLSNQPWYYDDITYWEEQDDDEWNSSDEETL